MRNRYLVALRISAALTLVAILLWVTYMPGTSFDGSPTPVDAALQKRLTNHIAKLSNEIGARSVTVYPSLIAAEKYLTDHWTTAGFKVERMPYTLTDGHEVANLEVLIPGTDNTKTFVIGAHYDSVQTCPGANDNATGAAAVLELASNAKQSNPPINLRFVLFVNEEPPYFQKKEQGSAVYVRAAAQRAEKIVGMLSIETIGYFSDAAGSQSYPFPFSLLYPSMGNFIGFVGNMRSGSFVRKTIGAFRNHGQIPSEGVAAPAAIPGIGWSDHGRFWDIGAPALMITDTAPFRYPHYHQQSDTMDKLDMEQMTRVVSGLDAALPELLTELR
ncbi:MAG: M28 family peptidase [Bdellovibrionota bacterium]